MGGESEEVSCCAMHRPAGSEDIHFGRTWMFFVQRETKQLNYFMGMFQYFSLLKAVLG